MVIVGNKNWAAADPYLANNYTAHEYTFLWWPMEDYRRISWNAVLGVGQPEDQPRRGLLSADVRQALWDIFFHRDYQKYGEVFGGTYTAGEWPLRHDLRLYVRNDVVGNLWDYGVGGTSVALVDPYEGGQLAPAATVILNAGGIAGAGAGTLSSPRNVAAGPDGLIYVADSGNHRIQVFDRDGTFVRGWGGFGAAPGQFNEPCGGWPWARSSSTWPTPPGTTASRNSPSTANCWARSGPAARPQPTTPAAGWASSSARATCCCWPTAACW